MKRIALVSLFILFIAIPATAAAADGMINVKSSYTVEKTAARMESILKEKGMTIFNIIKHSEGASKVGIELRDTQLIIFGNPKVGSPLMQCQQSVALDLPQKALIWEDNKANVWISYNDPRYLQKRHRLTGCDKIIAKIENALAGITKAASSK